MQSGGRAYGLEARRRHRPLDTLAVGLLLFVLVSNPLAIELSEHGSGGMVPVNLGSERPIVGDRAGPGSTPVNPSALSVLEFTIEPTSVVRVQEVNLTVNVSGGTQPYSFAFTNLPAGCFSWNGSRFSCYPAESGHFIVEVQVTDSQGDVAWANSSLTVTPGGGSPPEIISFGATPSRVQVRDATNLAVDAVSRSSTPTSFLTFAYFDLPPGCSSFNQTPLICLPTAAGTYHVQVEVSDGFGAYTFNTTTIVVLPGPSSGGSGSGGWLPWAITGIVIVIAAIAIPVVVIRRRRAPPGGEA